MSTDDTLEVSDVEKLGQKTLRQKIYSWGEELWNDAWNKTCDSSSEPEVLIATFSLLDAQPDSIEKNNAMMRLSTQIAVISTSLSVDNKVYYALQFMDFKILLYFQQWEKAERYIRKLHLSFQEKAFCLIVENYYFHGEFERAEKLFAHPEKTIIKSPDCEFDILKIEAYYAILEQQAQQSEARFNRDIVQSYFQNIQTLIMSSALDVSKKVSYLIDISDYKLKMGFDVLDIVDLLSTFEEKFDEDMVKDEEHDDFYSAMGFFLLKSKKFGEGLHCFTCCQFPQYRFSEGLRKFLHLDEFDVLPSSEEMQYARQMVEDFKDFMDEDYNVDYEIYFSLIEAELKTYNVDNALHILEDIFDELDSEEKERAYFFLAKCHYEKGHLQKYEEAKTHIKDRNLLLQLSLVRLRTNSVGDEARVGEEAEKAEEEEAAATIFFAALNECDHHGQYRELIVCFAQRGKWEKVFEFLTCSTGFLYIEQSLVLNLLQLAFQQDVNILDKLHRFISSWKSQRKALIGQKIMQEYA